MEPVTLITTAIVLGVAAGLKSTTEQVIKDSYQGLKQLIETRYKLSLKGLENKPDSKVQRAAIEEALTDAGADKDKDLLNTAKDLIELIENKSPETVAKIDIDVDRVKAEYFKAENAQALGEGTTAEVKAKFSDSTFTGGIQIGGASAKVEGEADPKD